MKLDNMIFRSLLLWALPAAQAASYIPPGMDKALTGSNVPERFLESAKLAGAFPPVASRSDPRVSYAIYVPPEHYSPHANSTHGKGRLPLLVDIHGTSRTTTTLYDEDQHRRFAHDTPCAVLAPLFPAGLEDANDLDSYMVLRSPSLRSDAVLLDILDEVAYRWPGVETREFFLMGFSGGGQFAHRFLYLHPERLAAVSVGAPGSVTTLDETRDWPEGVADVDALFGVQEVRKDEIARVPIQLVVGDEDNEVAGDEDREFREWLEEAMGGGSGGLPTKELGRMDTAIEMQSVWEEDGIESQLDIVPGAGHDSTDPRILEAVYEYMGPLIREARLN